MTARAFDVAVVGAGPAGAAAALALCRRDPGLRVAMIAPPAGGAPRVGETLHPAARPLLERLGVWDRFARSGHLDAFGTVSAWGTDELREDDFITSVLGHGFQLDRRVFDAMLLDAAVAEGACAVRASLSRARRAGGGFRLDLDAGGAVEARFVIDATGRRARAACALGTHRVLFDRLVTAVVFFDAGDNVSADTRTLVEAVEDGWWYAARIPGGGAVTAFSTDGDIARRLRLRDADAFQAALAATRHTRARMAGARARGGPRIHASDSSALDVAAGDGWVAVGDAALAFDPLSGQGLVKALSHGLLSAYAASDHLAGRPSAGARFAARIRGEIEGYLVAHERVYRDEARFPSAPFWRRRRPRIQLSPTAVLSARAPEAVRTLHMHLSRADLACLAALAGERRAAHEVLAAARRAGVTSSDRRLVLALQYLVEEGVIAVHEAAAPAWSPNQGAIP